MSSDGLAAAVTEIPDRTYFRTPATAPGPSGPDMMRAIGQIRGDPLGFLGTMRDQHGDVVQFPIPSPPTYLVSSAAGAQHVLVRNARNYGKQTIQYRSLSLVTGNGLLTSDGDTWRQQRTVSQPAFNHIQLPDLAAICEEEIAKLVTRWRRPNRQICVDVEAALLDVTLRVVGRALFGDDLQGRTAALASATLAALEVVIQRSRVPIAIPSFVPSPANRKLKRSMTALEDAVSALVAGRSATDGEQQLLIDLFLNAGWSAQEVRDQIVTFLVAGHETVASACTWALFAIAQDPLLQVRVGETEAHAIQVAAETLRLYPPAWVVTRQALSPDQIGGFEIPESALVIVSPYLLHRDKRYWANPEQFQSDRFAAGTRSQAYLPFGSGARLCIGRDFALLEMRVILHRLCQSVVFAPTRGQVKALPGVTLRPGEGLQLMVAPR